MKDETRKSFDTLLNRLKVNSQSVILLNIGDAVLKSDLQHILDYFLNRLKDGTLCLVGDCEFNTNKTDLNFMKDWAEKTRKELFLPIEFKLLGLKEGVRSVNHPSLEIVCYGKHAQYLTRHQSLDFPYGEKSIFNDLYDLDAVYLSIGQDPLPYALKYAGYGDDMVIFRNTCLYEDTLYSYLDFSFDYNQAAKHFEGHSLYELSETRIYGERYRYLIDQMKNPA